MIKRIFLIGLLLTILAISSTCVLSVLDTKNKEIPKVETAHYVVKSLSRIYYIDDPRDLIYDSTKDTNTMKNYWYSENGRWIYTNIASSFPVKTFGPLTLTKREIQ